MEHEDTSQQDEDERALKQQEHVRGVLQGKPQGGKDVSGVPLEAHASPRFDLEGKGQKEAFLAHLHEHGYAVVANVMSPAQCEASKNLMWDYLEGLTPSRRDDPATWENKNWLPSGTNGIVHGFGFGQTEFMWSLRLLPRVKEAFAAVWDTDDLLVSFDGGNAMRPWQLKREWLTDGGWYHVDQNANRPGRSGQVCVQGLVTLCPVTEHTGGLVVVPGSHHHHDEMCHRIEGAQKMGDFVPVPLEDPVMAGGARLVLAHPGDLVLWDSRTVHCNTPALSALRGQGVMQESAEGSHGKLIRQVGYVCMTPAAWATREVLEQRRQGYVNNTSCSHWPHTFEVGGHAVPGMPDNDPMAISAAQRALIGFDRPAEDSKPTEKSSTESAGELHDRDDGGCKRGCVVT